MISDTLRTGAPDLSAGHLSRLYRTQDGRISLQIGPFSRISQLWAWESAHSHDVFDSCLVSTVPHPHHYRRSSFSNNNGDRCFLVCHDMRGNYLSDRFVYGATPLPPEDARFTFTQWRRCHTFVYFAHQLVAPPPRGVVEAAHRNGVAILGTFITEWEEGERVHQQLLSSQSTISRTASALANMADHYGFDGWLINIEAKTVSAAAATLMAHFVALLREYLRKKGKGGLVVWYDSLINSGELSWQNALNDLNTQFFRETDAIFLNYCWTEDHLRNSATSVEKENRPRRDVLVGVDVWGRGCPGGGGEEGSAHALQCIAKHSLSVALFAVAWTYETAEEEVMSKRSPQDLVPTEMAVKNSPSEDSSKKEESQEAENTYLAVYNAFRRKDESFYSSLDPYLPSRNPSLFERRSQMYSFISNFCDGYGHKLVRMGDLLLGEPWLDYAQQTTLPICSTIRDSLKRDGAGRQQVEVFLDHDGEVFDGGSALLIRVCNKVTGNGEANARFESDAEDSEKTKSTMCQIEVVHKLSKGWCWVSKKTKDYQEREDIQGWVISTWRSSINHLETEGLLVTVEYKGDQRNALEMRIGLVRIDHMPVVSDGYGFVAPLVSAFPLIEVELSRPQTVTLRNDEGDSDALDTTSIRLVSWHAVSTNNPIAFVDVFVENDSEPTQKGDSHWVFEKRCFVSSFPVEDNKRRRLEAFSYNLRFFSTHVVAPSQVANGIDSSAPFDSESSI